MNKFILLLLILTLPLAAADLQELTTTIEAAQSELIGQELPGPLGQLFGDEKVNLHITLNEGDITLGIETYGNKIAKISLEPVKKQSLDVYITEATLNKVLNSNNPLSALLTALENDEITYKAKGFFNKIKFAFINLLINMAGGFAEETADNIIVEPLEKIEISEPEPVIEELVVEEEPEEVEEELNEITANFVAPPINLIELTNTGFSQPQIVINAGESVTFKNVRDGKVDMAMIVGTNLCRDVKSKIFYLGEEFTANFDKQGTCTIVDGIMTTKIMKVIVR